MNHRDRILKRILKSNFIGAVLTSKDIIPTKVQLFDVTADISIKHVDSNKSMLIVDYGDSYYSFDIIYEVRVNKTITSYIIKNIF